MGRGKARRFFQLELRIVEYNEAGEEVETHERRPYSGRVHTELYFAKQEYSKITPPFLRK